MNAILFLVKEGRKKAPYSFDTRLMSVIQSKPCAS